MNGLRLLCKAGLKSLGAICFLSALSFAGADSTAAGENLFKSHCVLCHGTDATGNTTMGKQLKARNLHSAIVQKKSDAELKHVITDGEGNMPPFSAQLTSAQIDQLVTYVRQLGKTKK
jgi:ubiquinol-cytochrome c reductase cytochrome c subunit